MRLFACLSVVALAIAGLAPSIPGVVVSDEVAATIHGGCTGAVTDTCTGTACGETTYVKPPLNPSSGQTKEPDSENPIECGGTVECADRAASDNDCST